MLILDIEKVTKANNRVVRNVDAIVFAMNIYIFAYVTKRNGLGFFE